VFLGTVVNGLVCFCFYFFVFPRATKRMRWRS
jgi:hypothetical protein